MKAYIETQAGSYTIDSMSIPAAEGNRHYRMMLDEVSKGEAKITPYVEPPVDPVAEFKAARPAVIAAIKVTVDDMVFDGDEVSQTRMTRAILAMDEGESTTWVLANDKPVTVTRAQLKAALRLAGEAQTAAWVFS